MPDTRPQDLLAPALPTFEVTPAPVADVLADLESPDVILALPVASGGLALDGVVADALVANGLTPASVAAAYEPSATAGSITAIPLVPGERPARLVLLVGAGDGSANDLRTAGAALGRRARGHARLVTSIGSGSAPASVAAFVEGVVLASWTSPRWSADGPTRVADPVAHVTLSGDHDHGEVGRALSRARATLVARNLAIVPSNIKKPAWMVARSRTIARRSGLAVTVWTERDLAREGFGGLLAVGAGSVSPPRLVRLDYEPPGATSAIPRVVIVGKGITFDSGGLDIKPADGMLAMKTDMSGSAIVLAVLSVCRELGVPVRVTGLLALAENAVSGAAYRPSDVIIHYGGRTVEVGNTDAEGRLVLADALAYADAQLDPDLLLDIATLTGAARVALARTMAPVFTTDADLEQALVAAGATTGETLWPLPLVADYRQALDSTVADLSNHAPRVGGGSIVAALFLREFVGSRRWAHLDIAGAGRSDLDSGILGKGGTGFGTRLLLRWLEAMG